MRLLIFLFLIVLFQIAMFIEMQATILAVPGAQGVLSAPSHHSAVINGVEAGF
jgi:hypothetical protein